MKDKNLIELVTILLGLFTLIFGILQYFWQKRFEEKLRGYKNYLEIVSLSTLSPDEQKHIKSSSEEISDGRKYSLLFLYVKVEVSC